MKETELIMGMPVTVEVVDTRVTQDTLEIIFSYFRQVDEKFSTYKTTSEISRINRNELTETEYSDEMKQVLTLSEDTKQATGGYFDIAHNGKLDPSGLVKGWAIHNAAALLLQDGFTNFYVEAGGDIEVHGHNEQGKPWRVGIRDPFTTSEKKIVKVVYLNHQGIATSGTYLRGQHVYNPKDAQRPITDIVSLTVIGPNIYEADRFATAAFAMGRVGIEFIEQVDGLEGYLIDSNGLATMTSQFEHYTVEPTI